MVNICIRVRNLSVAYDEHYVLKNISMDIPCGELVVIAGPRGSGKTTLLYALSGFIPHIINCRIEGDIEILGINPLRDGIETLVDRVFLLHSELNLHFLTEKVLDELRLHTEDMEYLNEIVEYLGLREYLDKDPKKLSAGLKQRLALALALTKNTKILLLDEPLSYLDMNSIQVVTGILYDLVLKGMTIIVSEHRIDYLLPIANKIAILVNGELRYFGTPRSHQALETIINSGMRVPPILKLFTRLNNILRFRSIPLTINELMEELTLRCST